MNYRIIGKMVGTVLCIEGLCMLFPLAIAVADGGDGARALLLSALICVLVGYPVSRVQQKNSRIHSRDGFCAAALCWIVLSLFGAMPYVLSGTASFTDALFETASGFTTTGATIFSQVEPIPRGILMWRALTHWMGGMGVLVLALALLPRLGEGGFNLMCAESTGPIKTKIKPRLSDTAKTMYAIYVALTALEVLCLCIAGMPLYDSVAAAFATISTGGFFVHTASIAYYDSLVIHWIIIIFMFLSGINFSLIFLVLCRRFREAVRNEELWFYTGVTVTATTLITLTLVAARGMPPFRALTDAAFQVVSIITTTGFITADYDLWPNFARMLILFLMFFGGCAGSTAGGIKHIRVLILFKGFRRTLRGILHPREVKPVCIDGERVEEETVTTVFSFFFCYIAIFLVSAVLFSLFDGLSIAEALGTALTAISNVGPAFGAVGPTYSFGFLSGGSKLLMTLLMLMGRLEIMPFFVLAASFRARRRVR